MGRIDITQDTIFEVVLKMAEGNPGAVTILMRLIKEGEFIDRMDWMQGLGSIVELDHLGIYGSRIWVLYKDYNGEDLPRMIASLRAVQLGLLNADDLRGGSFQTYKVAEAVVERLGKENFILTEV